MASEVEAHEDEPLQFGSEDRRLYLVKVPASLGKIWKNIEESDVKIGNVNLGKRDSAGRRKGKLQLDTSNSIASNLPSEYRLEFGPASLKAKVFSQDGSGRMAIEGTVIESGTVMPQRNTDYSRLCKQRLLKSMVKDRYVKALEELPRAPTTAKIQFTIDPPKVVEEDDDLNAGAASSSADKKVKMEKEELKNLVFHHFEDRAFWPLKELNIYCRQPEGFLKEVLKEICVYHRKGLNKSCYELKPQYKHNGSNPN